MNQLVNIKATLRLGIQCILCLLVSSSIYANDAPLLPAAQAFAFSAESDSSQTATLRWQIAPDYYLYQQKIAVTAQKQNIAIAFPKAIAQHDENFGQSLVYYHNLAFKIQVQPNTTYSITWQGCAKDRLCYPPQHTEVTTDLNGLISQDQAQTHNALRLSDLAAQSSNMLQPAAAAIPSQNVKSVAEDQRWSDQLQDHSFIYGLGLFLGLGFLLAFTPCSLPMLPIVSSLILRDQKGTKAWLTALTFVVSMASVYALLGIVASYAGLGFQRWLQQPSTLIAFSGLFILFALNLFGLFEIRLPSALTNRLDRVQSTQKGGSLMGTAVMGAVSALLVGPCMTAPLAGALLFISQTQNQWHGAALLFALGFGMGIPLLLVSLVGTKVLPKAGEWMNQIKIIFAFIMLGLALYFVRPLLSPLTMLLCSQALFISATAYALYAIYKQSVGLKALYLVLAIGTVSAAVYTQHEYQNAQSQHDVLTWHVAKNANEFQQLLSQAPANQAVVIDVYADWCVACQPIEHKILKQADVQQALQPYYLIKFDLSQYDPSQQTILSTWDLLGPPTYLFLNTAHQEQRELRLTGEFHADTLLTQLAALKP